MSGQVVNTRFAKTDQYRKVLEIYKKAGNCPFCKKEFKKLGKPMLKKYKGWFATDNNWPYKNTRYHFLIVSEKHREKLQEFRKNDFEAVLYLAQWLVKKYRIKGGGLALRFGSTDFSGSSVCHSHFHLISPKVSKGKSLTVIFPIG